MESAPLMPPVGLAPSSLNAPKESTYFAFVVVISVLVWLGLALTIVGIPYALFIAFFIWLGNGLLAAYLRAEAVKVSERQMPELAATFREVCATLGVKQPPALYLLQAGGMLNAFAMRHTGRNFVVVYSDLIEALGPSSREMKFLLGHEIGHLQSNHPLKHALLAPGLFFPLIGPAYRRAWETSCDRYGTLAAGDVTSAARGLLVLAGGRERGPQLDAAAYAAQYTDDRGFFVSLHELTSTYPTLSRRVVDVLALREGRTPARAPRHPFAFVLGAFMPGGGMGSASPASAMIMVVLIGMMAAMAIPAFQKVRQASQQKACFNNGRILEAALDQYSLENGKGPGTWDEIVGPQKILQQMPACPTGGTYSAELEGSTYKVKCSQHGSVHDAPSAPPSH